MRFGRILNLDDVWHGKIHQHVEQIGKLRPEVRQGAILGSAQPNARGCWGGGGTKGGAFASRALNLNNVIPALGNLRLGEILQEPGLTV